MNILAIDPGPEQSACIIWDGERAMNACIQPNISILESLRMIQEIDGINTYDAFAIEMVACYGMPVGKEVFETCVWIGRMIERCPKPPTLVYRKDVKMHFCHSMRAKDANVRQAILDRFGGKDKAIGKKGCYGPLRSVKSHLWSALAIALYIQDTLSSSNGAQAKQKVKA